MADIADLAQERIEIENARALKNAVTYKGQSSLYCHECGDPIPDARRQAVQGCSLCIDCQEIEDKKQKHRN